MEGARVFLKDQQIFCEMKTKKAEDLVPSFRRQEDEI
jgi:hypothetical protein